MNAQKMVLVDPTHKLPMPGQARMFSTDGETVDMHNVFWRNLVKDGSIKAPDEAPSLKTSDAPAPGAPVAPPAADATTSTSSPLLLTGPASSTSTATSAPPSASETTTEAEDPALVAAETAVSSAVSAIEALRHHHG